MPATSRSCSGDKPHATANNAARMTSAICSTGIVAKSLVQRRPGGRSSTPQARPTSNEPHTTTARSRCPATSSESVALTTLRPARATALIASTASTLLMARQHQQPLGHLAARPRLVQRRHGDDRRGRIGERAGQPQRRRGGAPSSTSATATAAARPAALQHAAGGEPRVVEQPARPQPACRVRTPARRSPGRSAASRDRGRSAPAGAAASGLASAPTSR